MPCVSDQVQIFPIQLSLLLLLPHHILLMTPTAA